MGCPVHDTGLYSSHEFLAYIERTCVKYLYLQVCVQAEALNADVEQQSWGALAVIKRVCFGLFESLDCLTMLVGLKAV